LLVLTLEPDVVTGAARKDGGEFERCFARDVVHAGTLDFLQIFYWACG